ncbi:hypothetical protein [Actinokineospora enzanensis]|uniref:hypothetical protein n=1 Tax=Actinokineospora enzanensis TaxID=155975 RepID=UPI0003714BE9|nr:hypothetical protein [Actinokineospora enzanensis]
MTCVDCVAGVEHCHGTLVGSEGCTEPGCEDLSADRHPLVIEAAEVDSPRHLVATAA